jgi:hypothetical protein
MTSNRKTQVILINRLTLRASSPKWREYVGDTTAVSEYPRFKVTLPIEIRPVGLQVPLRAQTEDISSLGGFYVEMTFTQRVSTELNIAIWIGDEKIQAKGVVGPHLGCRIFDTICCLMVLQRML